MEEYEEAFKPTEALNGAGDIVPIGHARIGPPHGQLVGYLDLVVRARSSWTLWWPTPTAPTPTPTSCPPPDYACDYDGCCGSSYHNYGGSYGQRAPETPEEVEARNKKRFEEVLDAIYVLATKPDKTPDELESMRKLLVEYKGFTGKDQPGFM